MNDGAKMLVSSHHDKTVLNGSDGECGWNCTYKVNESVSLSFFSPDGSVPKAILNEGTLFRIRVRYEMKVDDKCIKQTLRNSSVNGTKQWRVRLIRPTNKKVPSFIANSLKSFSTYIEEEFLCSVEALCTLKVRANCTTSQTCYTELSPDDFKEKTLYLTHIGWLGDICSANPEENNKHSCIEINEFKYERKENLPSLLVFVLVAVISYIGPYIICLFSATEVTHRGIRQLILDGPSPVGVRSLIGNYFFSIDDTMPQRARGFIMRVFILPTLFLIPALFAEYLLCNNVLPRQNTLHITPLFQPLKVLCYGCYCYQGIYLHFLISRPKEESCSNPYVSARNLEKFLWIWDLPFKMSIHLRIFQWFFVQTFRVPSLALLRALEHIADGFHNRPSLKPTAEFRWFTILFLSKILGIMCAIPIVVILELEFYPFLIMMSFPIANLCSCGNLYKLWGLINIKFLDRDSLYVVQAVVVLLDICVSWLAAFGGLLFLRSAALGLLLLCELAVTVVLSEESIQFVACFILASYYLWSSYSSFTDKYQELAVALFNEQVQLIEQYKALHENPYYKKDSVRRIPKELFNTACEELMPIKETTRKLASKLTAHLMFLFVVLLLTILLDATPLTKTLLMFAAGLVPRVATFYFNRSKEINIEATSDVVAHRIVRNYFQITSITLPKMVSRYEKLDILETQTEKLVFGNVMVDVIFPSVTHISFTVIVFYLVYSMSYRLPFTFA